jgi:DNA transposition AAA+ family ATPase
MNKQGSTHEEFTGFGLDETDVAARRLQTYSQQALDVGLPMDNLFVVHQEFSDAVKGVDRIFQLATKVNMAHGMWIVGPPGTGKTALLEYFQRSLPQSNLFAPGLGAVYVRVPHRAAAHSLISSLLRHYGYVHKRITTDTIDYRLMILAEAIRQKGTRVILIDEAQNLFDKGSGWRSSESEGNRSTDLIRQIMDLTRVGLVFAGVGVLENMRDFDPALANRVNGRYQLSLFKYDTQWIRLLKSMVMQASSFDISVILQKDVCQIIHKCTGGNLRNLKRLVTEMVLVAVDSNAQAVDSSHLSIAYQRVNGALSDKGNPFVS